MNYEILQGDALATLKTLPSGIVQTCVTSPPYYGLRSYIDEGHEDKSLEIGLEETPEAYVAKLVEVFREVRRVLHPTGTIWVNLGDSYASTTKGDNRTPEQLQGKSGLGRGDYKWTPNNQAFNAKFPPRKFELGDIKPKDLIGIPWMVAFALRADGWVLRSEIIWHKRAPMPESVQDRPTKAHEQLFLLAKSPHYYYDAEAIKEPSAESTMQIHSSENVKGRAGKWKIEDNFSRNNGGVSDRGLVNGTGRDLSGRNKRSVWTLGPESYSGAHFATMPTKLVEPCILAGTSAHGCCAKCGAPWERVVERETRAGTGVYDSVTEAAVLGTKVNGTSLRGNPGKNLGVLAKKSIGWQPTCQCQADVQPCLVLDPFCGSGTTLAVALKHGRRGLGLELNESYIELAHKRIASTQPMLLDVTA